jgi:ubiquinone/menaquinone biosynthesis C-methylase UbiE
MLSGSEKYYDDIYSALGKDYAAEANKVHEFIQKYKRTDGNTLLDVACGTGTHAGLLSKHYKVEGTDVNADMLRVARKKHPEIRFFRGDMRNLALERRFDVLTCLFSAVGYMTTKSDLQKAVRSMSRHLLPGGVLLLEPWFSPEQWNVGRVSINQVEKSDLKVIRMAHAGKRGRVSLLEFEYLIGTSRGIEHIVEHHEFGLFSHAEYTDAFTRTGLDVTHDPQGLSGRGLYIGTKPLDKS